MKKADEAQGWLQLLAETGKASGLELQRLLGEATELVKIFSASKRTSMANRRRNTKRHKQKPPSD